MCSRDPYWRALQLLVLFVCLNAPALARDCIGVVPAGASAFWSQLELGTQQAARELDIDVLYRGPSREGGVDSQLQLIERFVARGCKALIVAPSGEAVGGLAAELLAQGIPTIYIDRALASGPLLGLVATDNFAAGLRAGRHMAEQLQGRGRVALLRLRQGLQSTGERERGFRQGAEAGGLQVVLDTYVGDDSQLVLRTLEQQVARLDGLFTPNSSSTRAALAALRRLGKAGQLLHIGFDGDEVLLEALRLGDIHALLVQQSRLIGYRAVMLARQMLGSDLTQAAVYTRLEARLITRANMNELHEQLQGLPATP
jgi:ribose transport system substrate-binding protein